VLKSVVTAASCWGTSIPIRKYSYSYSLGRHAWPNSFGESHGKKAKEQHVYGRPSTCEELLAKSCCDYGASAAYRARGVITGGDASFSINS
jgi:hypothetical protein